MLTQESRPDFDGLISQLTQLGATHVFTYDALSDKSLAKHVKQWTSSSVSTAPCTASTILTQSSTADPADAQLRRGPRHDGHDTATR